MTRVESPEPNILTLSFTCLPTAVIASIFLAMQYSLWFLFAPLVVFVLWILFKPLEHCEYCNQKIEHKIVGPYDMHTQCDCVKNRWRPIWHLWAEQIHKRIFRQGDHS